MRKKREKPEEVALTYVKAKKDRDGFHVREVPPKGRGVFASRNFENGEFLLEYSGKLCTGKEGDKLENDDSSGYRFFFKFKGQDFCIDATEEVTDSADTPSYGRLVNHGEKAEINVKIRIIDAGDTPAMCLFALREITEGEELLYDYGVKNLPWLTKKPKAMFITSKISKELGTKKPDKDEAEKEGKTGETKSDGDKDQAVESGNSDEPAEKLHLCQTLNRWSHQVDQLLNSDSSICIKSIGRLCFSRQLKIADGSNGAQIFVGLVDRELPVAVKRMNRDSISMDIIVAEVLNEKSNRRSPHVLRHILSEEDDDFIYLASPLCEYNLEEVIENHQNPLRPDLTEDKRAVMSYQLMLGLAELHQANILHRDLKPSNVLLDHSSKLLLGDFGISRQIQSGTTLLTKAMGTLCWTSPETDSNNCVRYKKSSDIQMLACLMYYILSDGHVPHETTVPYTNQPDGVLSNMRRGHFSLKNLGKNERFRPLLCDMLNPDEKLRPTIQGCISRYEKLQCTPESDAETIGTDNTSESHCSTEPVGAPCGLRAFSFVASGLTNNSKKRLVQKLADLHGCKYSDAIDSSTTHVIVAVGETSLCSRTMKYMMGIASGLWIVSYSWVQSSLEAGILLPEADYEIQGDDALGAHFGPFRARTRKESLLSGYSICLLGSSAKVTEDEVTNILKLTGANSPDATYSIALYDEEVDNNVFDELWNEKMTQGYDGRPIVSINWLLDTVSKHEIQSLGMYRHLNPVMNHTDVKEFSGESSSESSDDSSDEYTPENDDKDANFSDDSTAAEDEIDSDELAELCGSDAAETRQTSPSAQAGKQGCTQQNKDGESSDPFVVDSVNKSKYCYCPFCDTSQQKLPRHCRRFHPEEVLVAKASSVPKENYQLNRGEWRHIRNMGNHKHNKLVYQGEAKDLVVQKRPPESKTHSIHSYVPCTTCLGYYHKDTLWVHKKSCHARATSSEALPSCSNHVKEGRKLIPLKNQNSGELTDCVNGMVVDQQLLLVRNDRDILQVGQNTLDVSNSSRKKDKAREKMRTIAKVLQHAKEMDPKIEESRDLIHPSKFDVVVQCARMMSGFNETSQVHKSYSSALRVGHALADLATVIKNDYIKLQMRDRVADVDDFMYLRNTEWRIRVTASAQRQSQENRWKSPKLLPLTEDCVTFNTYLQGQESKLKSAATKGFTSSEAYRQFASVTLAQVIFFNRRRPKEVEQITVQDYLDQIAHKTPVHDEVRQSLTFSERISLKRLTMLMVRGKRGRGVPILLPGSLKQSLDMLAQHNKGRRFLFSRVNPQSLTPLRGYEAMAELATTCTPSLKQPNNMRCTKLRKHLATMSQLLNLNDTELEQLANHMGHDINVHREYYRLPMEALILAKVSKMLTLSQEGVTYKYQGKSLDDVVIHPDEQLETAESDDGADTEDGTNDDDEDDDRDDSAGTSSADDDSVGDDDTEGEESTKTTKPTGRTKYTRWSTAEENFLFRQKEVKTLLATRRVPGKSLCLLIKQRAKGILNDKTWQDMKNKIHNTNRAEKSRLEKKN